MLLPSTPNKTALFAVSSHTQSTGMQLHMAMRGSDTHGSTLTDCLWRQSCEAEWGTVPRAEWEEHQFGGPNVGGSSNIFLSAGQLDPWRAGGIARADLPKDLDPSIELWENIGGAHHLDLRASNPLDPPTLTECRVRQLAAIKRWIKEWAANPPKPTDP